MKMKKSLLILALSALILTGGAYGALACGWGGYYGAQGSWYCPWAGQGNYGGGGCGWYGQDYGGRGHMRGYAWDSRRSGWNDSYGFRHHGNGADGGYRGGAGNVRGAN